MGESDNGFDAGILFVLLGILYIVVAGFLLVRSDWNPRTPNYLQFLVNVAGEYTGGTPFEGGYALVAVDGNSALFVITDEHGEVKSAYSLSHRPAAVLSREDGLYFVFVEGNRIQIMGYSGGKFSTLAAVSTSWSFQPLGPPRILTGSRLILFAKRGNLEGPVVLDIEKNVYRPRLTAYFCRDCGLSPKHVLPDGSVYGGYGKYPVLIRLEESGAVALTVDTDLIPFITDVCEDFFVGFDVSRRLVFGSLSGDSAYELNVPVGSFPVCFGRKIFFSSSGSFVMVDVGPDLNSYRIYSSYSGFEPSGVFEDVPYVVLYGESSGNPSLLRNVVGEMKCPDTLQPIDSDMNLRAYPLRVERLDVLKESPLVGYPAEPFATARRVSVDEDFRCYSP